MKRTFKSKKALSPVVAAFTLTVLTVAVAIFVASWLGAITFTFMKTEEYKTIFVDVPDYANATHVKWWFGNNYTANKSKGIVPLPCVASEKVMVSKGCWLEVTYYKEVNPTLFEAIGKKHYEYSDLFEG